MKIQLEQRRAGVALVKEGQATPLGYLRAGRLRMKCGDDYEEFSPEDFRLLAEIIEAQKTLRIVRAATSSPHVPSSTP